MPSTYSPNLRLELIASGEQGNSWGNTTNTNIGTLLEQAISGYKALTTGWVGNSLTLTAYNGAVDDARAMFLSIPVGVSLSAAGTITAPPVPKFYVIRNASSGGYAITITTGSGVTSTIPNGATKVVVCDGTNFYDAVTAASSFAVPSAPSNGSDITNKTYVDAGDAARLKKDGSENMTGELLLSAGTEPSNTLAAVSKQYVNSTFLPLTGGTMTGPLTLTSSTPTGNQAVSRNFLNTIAITAGTGITVNGSVSSGALSVALNPATAGTIGGVKPGAGISIAADGTISWTGTSGGVTSIGVTSANGFSGSSSGGSAPSLTLSTTISGVLKGSGGALAAATGSDVASALGSTAVQNSAQLGGVAASGYLRTNGSNYISNAGNTFLDVESITSGYAGRIGAFYSLTANDYLPFVGSYSPGGGYAPLVFVQFQGSTYVGRANINPSGSFGVNNLANGSGATVQADSGGYLYVTSDANRKIFDGYIDEALPSIMQLTPRYFNWKEYKEYPKIEGGRQLGFFAQEVNAVIPEAAATPPEDNPDAWGINDRALIAMLVKAVQELKAEIDALKGA